MTDFYHEFYKKNSKKFRKYEFSGTAKLVSGEKYDFFDYLKKFLIGNRKVLDLGCGSGELTLRIAPMVSQIYGIDPYENYIATARKQQAEAKVKNAIFVVADGKKLPFQNEFFDLIISSRGPLSANADFLGESSRVLKKGGLMIEETIGEKDKLELKQIFGRGQNYPVPETRLKSITRLLKKIGLKLVHSKDCFFDQIYPSINEVTILLERAPIIPSFEKNNDRKYLEEVNKKLNHEGIRLSSHRLYWIATK